MAALISQYEDFPLGQNPETGKDSNDQTPEESKNITKIVYGAIGLIILIIFYVVFFSGSGHSAANDKPLEVSTDKPLSSDLTNKSLAKDTNKSSRCGPLENCFTNPKDCACPSDYYCSNESKFCVKPNCGNGKCEPGEYVDTCCTDCGCAYPNCQECDNKTNICSAREVELSDESAIQAVKDYYLNKGKVTDTIIMINSTCAYYQSGPMKQASVSFSDSNDTQIVVITAEGKVAERVFS
jgi:hypothetical protein